MLVVLVAAVYAVVGWDVSNQILDGLRATPEQTDHDTDVAGLRRDEITLRRSDEDPVAADRDAVLGLAWDGGYARIGPSRSPEGATEVRPFELLDGTPPPTGEQVAEVDADAFPADPARSGIDYTTVTYPGPMGELEAWRLAGEGATWLIGVHGRGADRAELLRLVSATRELDYPTLLIQYRNDPGAPATEGSLLLGGQRAWRDVAAAVDYARGQGAADVVLYGTSMGGALSLGYLLEADAPPVRGVILQAPAADLREIIRLRSDEGLPISGPVADSLVAVGRAIVWLRTGLDFDTVDYVARADQLDSPVLLFHGTDDETIPFSVSQALARSRPDLVDFHPVPDAAHVRAWNEDPDRFATIVNGFLQRLGRSR